MPIIINHTGTVVTGLYWYIYVPFPRLWPWLDSLMVTVHEACCLSCSIRNSWIFFSPSHKLRWIFLVHIFEYMYLRIFPARCYEEQLAVICSIIRVYITLENLFFYLILKTRIYLFSLLGQNFRSIFLVSISTVERRIFPLLLKQKNKIFVSFYNYMHHLPT